MYQFRDYLSPGGFFMGETFQRGTGSDEVKIALQSN